MLPRLWMLGAFLCSFCIFDKVIYGERTEILPKDPLVATGDNVTFNCSVNSGDFKNLLFLINGSSVTNSDSKIIISRRNLAKLTLINVQRTMTGRIECHHKSKTVISDSTFLTVADKPRPQPIKECRVYNWNRMTCTWDDPPAYGIQTDVSMSFSRSYNVDPLYKCPIRGKNNCTWITNHTPNTYMHIRHSIVLWTENRLGLEYTLIQFHPDDIVEPDSVSVFNCSANDSHSAFLGWKHSARKQILLYKVSVKPVSWENEPETVINTTSTNGHDLYDLIPNTVYNVTVECIPLVGGTAHGFWSLGKSCQFKTPFAVPGRSPSVTHGAYLELEPRENDHEGKRRHIHLFWQPVPKRWANGDIDGVRVRISKNFRLVENQNFSIWPFEMMNASSYDLTLLIRNASSDVQLELDADSSYAVTVEEKTSVGFNESLVPVPIIIPKKKDSPPFPERFIVSRDDGGRYFFNWSMVTNAHSYTLYWCTTTGNRRDLCTSSYLWQRLNASQLDYELHLPGHLCQLRFDISVEMVLSSGELVSSGMMRSTAIYKLNGELPKNLKIVVVGQKHKSLDIKWTDGMYCKHFRFISRYYVVYCESTNTCRQEIVDSAVDSMRLTDLTPGTTYQMHIRTCPYPEECEATQVVTASTLSFPAMAPVAEVAEAPLFRMGRLPVLSMIIAVSSLVLLAAICCFVCCLKKRLLLRKDIKIVLPQKKIELLNDQGQQSAMSSGQSVRAFLLPWTGNPVEVSAT